MCRRCNHRREGRRDQPAQKGSKVQIFKGYKSTPAQYADDYEFAKFRPVKLEHRNRSIVRATASKHTPSRIPIPSHADSGTDQCRVQKIRSEQPEGERQ